MHRFPIPVVLLAAALPAQEPMPLAALVDTVAPSIVTVRIVAELTLPPMMGGESQEIEEEALGAVVDASGIVMVPTAALDPGANMSMMFGDEMEIDSSVTSLKVVIGNDSKELNATVVAKDDKLGFSYVRIADLGDRQLTALRFDQKPALDVGAEVFAVRRLAEGYDFAPFVAKSTVVGKIDKPRNAWMLGDGLDVASPVFTADGKLCGVVARVEAAAGGGDDPRSMMMRMLGGGRGGARTFVVSPQVAANSIAQAVEAAAKTAAKDGEGAEKPADGEK